MQDRVLKYILRIPRYVTLPEHDDNLDLLLSDDPNILSIAELDRQVENLADRVVEVCEIFEMDIFSLSYVRIPVFFLFSHEMLI